MIHITQSDQTILISFWLIFTRWIGLTFNMPLFQNLSVPSILKVFFALIISYAFFPYLKGYALSDIAFVGVDHFWPLTISYLIIGLVIGLFVKYIMSIFYVAGTLIAQHIGLGASKYFDPISQQRLGPIEVFIQWVMIILILSSGALIPMFKGAFLSFKQFSIVNIATLNVTPEYVLGFFKEILTSGILLGFPLIMTHLLVMSIMGITSRSVPQMNILVVSFIVTILLGFFVFLITLDEFFVMGIEMYAGMLAKWFQAIT